MGDSELIDMQCCDVRQPRNARAPAQNQEGRQKTAKGARRCRIREIVTYPGQLSIVDWLSALDRGVVWLLPLLSLAILLSGLDDLLVDALWAYGWLTDKLRPAARLFPPGERQLASAPRQRIAILIPYGKRIR